MKDLNQLEAHCQLRRDLADLVARCLEEHGREAELYAETEDARMAGYHDGRAQAAEKFIRELTQILLDDASRTEEKEEENK